MAVAVQSFPLSLKSAENQCGWGGAGVLTPPGMQLGGHLAVTWKGTIYPFQPALLGQLSAQLVPSENCYPDPQYFGFVFFIF